MSDEIDLDLDAILARSESAQRWIYVEPTEGMPRVIREHFNYDVPTLIGAVKRLAAELEQERQELGRLRAQARADEAVKPLLDAVAEADRVIAEQEGMNSRG